MKNRYQVFISSTYEDLKKQRQKIAEAIQTIGWYPAGMELFPASDIGAWNHIERVMKESDLFLLISAGHYGSMKPDTNKSYTELEYELSKELADAGQLRQAVLIWDQTLGLDYIDVLDRAGSEKYLKQKVFQERLRNDMQGSVAYFHDDASLINRTHAVFNEFLRTAGSGWVRADQSPDHEELVELDKRVKTLELRLRESEARISSLRKVAALPTDVVELECTATYSQRGHKPFIITEVKDKLWSELFAVIGSTFDSPIPKSSVAVKKSIDRMVNKLFNKTSNGCGLNSVRVCERDQTKIINHLLRNQWINKIHREKTGVHYQLTPLGREAFLENETYPSEKTKE